MARLIVRWNYYGVDTSAAKKSALVNYIATRPGVDLHATHKSATARQQKLITQLLQEHPQVRDFFEYEDYLTAPTRANADELLQAAALELEFHSGQRSGYVSYMGTRPGADRTGEHGLFTAPGTPVDLSAAAQTVAQHDGNVWSCILSLTDTDADTYQLNSVQQWQEFLESQRSLFAQQLGIEAEHLQWYAAFHRKEHHPHVHLILYSDPPNRHAFLTKDGIEKVRSTLAHRIFGPEFDAVYELQNQYRSEVAMETERALIDALSALQTNPCASDTVLQKLQELAAVLNGTAGRKVYGYLPAETKRKVDEIVSLLQKDERICSAYTAWYAQRLRLLSFYRDDAPQLPPLASQKEFTRIKNLVIRAALSITETSPDIDLHSLPDKAHEQSLPETPPADPVPEQSDFIRWTSRYFEEMHLDSRDPGCDLSFAILSTMAENESKTLSSNVSWGYRRKFEAGSAAISSLYGYRLIKQLDENGRLTRSQIVPVEKEAEVVRRIYLLCLDGMSFQGICRTLNGEGIPAPRDGKNGWTSNTVRAILRNEKYTGDALCQKSYTVDPINKIRKKNTGEMPMYFIRDHHPAIVSRLVYQLVQEELDRRVAKPKTSTRNTKTNRGKYSSKYALSERLFCGKCGAVYKRCIWSRNKKIVWRCKNRWENGKTYCPESPSLEEGALQEAIRTAIYRLAAEQGNAPQVAADTLETALDVACEDGFDIAAARQEINALNQYIDNLVQITLDTDSPEDYFEGKIRELAEQRDALQRQLERHQHEQTANTARAEKLRQLRDLLNQQQLDMPAYSDALVHRTVQRIEVLTPELLRITFIGGIVMEQPLKAL